MKPRRARARAQLGVRRLEVERRRAQGLLDVHQRRAGLLAQVLDHRASSAALSVAACRARRRTLEDTPRSPAIAPERDAIHLDRAGPETPGPDRRPRRGGARWRPPSADLPDRREAWAAAAIVGVLRTRGDELRRAGSSGSRGGGRRPRSMALVVSGQQRNFERAASFFARTRRVLGASPSIPFENGRYGSSPRVPPSSRDAHPRRQDSPRFSHSIAPVPRLPTASRTVGTHANVRGGARLEVQPVVAEQTRFRDGHPRAVLEQISVHVHKRMVSARFAVRRHEPVRLVQRVPERPLLRCAVDGDEDDLEGRGGRAFRLFGKARRRAPFRSTSRTRRGCAAGARPRSGRCSRSSTPRRAGRAGTRWRP